MYDSDVLHHNWTTEDFTFTQCLMYVYIYMYGFFFTAGPSLGESEVKTEIACSLSQLGLLCSTYILF